MLKESVVLVWNLLWMSWYAGSCLFEVCIVKFELVEIRPDKSSHESTRGGKCEVVDNAAITRYHVTNRLRAIQYCNEPTIELASWDTLMSHDGDKNTESTLPVSTSSLILPAASQNISKTITSLTRSSLSILNRLSSIDHDSLFVRQVAQHLKLPVIANERCGSWYIRPDIKAGSAYFKSTDGHYGQWSFSTRRLNLQILDIVGEKGG